MAAFTTNELDAEQWRAVDGFNGYEVSSLGRVRSWRPVRNCAPRPDNPRIVVQCRNGKGYLHFSAMSSCSKTTLATHRVVLEAFHGPAREGEECRHLDGDPSNNRAANLVWGTRTENAADRVRHGTDGSGDRHWSRRHPERVSRGERHALLSKAFPGESHGNAKLTEGQAIAIIHASGTQSEIAAAYGIKQAQVSAIKTGRAWRHLDDAREAAGIKPRSHP